MEVGGWLGVLFSGPGERTLAWPTALGEPDDGQMGTVVKADGNGLGVSRNRMRGSRMTLGFQLKEPNRTWPFFVISWGWGEKGESIQMTVTLTLSLFINRVSATSMAWPAEACPLRKITDAWLPIFQIKYQFTHHC